MKFRQQGYEYEYARCSEGDVPRGVRFDTPRREQGQIVSLAWGTLGRAEGWVGAPFARVTDGHRRTAGYYRLVGETYVRGRESARA